MKFFKLLLVGVFILPLLGCPGKDFGTTINLEVINRSNNDIVVLHYFNANMNKNLPIQNPYIDSSQIYKDTITSNSTKIIPEAYRELFAMDSFNWLIVAIFSKDTIETVPWERIRDENLVLKRYDLTLEDLERRDWRIEYPE